MPDRRQQNSGRCAKPDGLYRYQGVTHYGLFQNHTEQKRRASGKNTGQRQRLIHRKKQGFYQARL